MNKRNLIAYSFIAIGLILFSFALLKGKNSSESLQLKEVLPSGEEQQVQQASLLSPPDEKIINGENRLIIDKIGVNAVINEGESETLALGIWHLPRTSTPDKGGNTVLSAHRWKYKPPDPRTFYDLNKLEIGDEIKVIWQGKKYIYKVRDIFEVTPDQVEVLGPSNKSELTLFTCTPLYSTARRLIIKADLIK